MDIKGRQKVDPNFNVSSMTDIIFLLLIFFIVTSKFVSEDALDLLLPKADGKVVQGGQPIAVSITKEGNFYVGKNLTVLDSIESALLRKFQTVEEQDRKLTVRAEQGVPIEKVVFLLAIANKNKYKTVLATQPMQ